MGLFDNLAGMLGGQGAGDQGQGEGGQGEGGQGSMNIVSSLLSQGGGAGGMLSSFMGGQAAQGGTGQGGAGQAPAGGGMAGMLEALAANGLGEHVSSWLSNNPNLPINPQQIHDALGSEQVQQMASSSGLPVGQFLQQLAQHLPAAASQAAGTDQG